MEIKWTLILVSHPCGERAGSPARGPRAPRAPCSSGRGGPAVVPQLALWGGRWRQRLSPPRWLQSRVRTVWGLPSSGGTRSIARQAPLFYRWGDTELNSAPASPSAAPAGPCSRRPRPPRPGYRLARSSCCHPLPGPVLSPLEGRLRQPLCLPTSTLATSEIPEGTFQNAVWIFTCL